MADDERRAEIEGVWHKDGPLAQVEAMAEWAERMGDPADNRHWETARKIAKNLRAAVESLSGAPSRDGTVAVEDVATFLRVSTVSGNGEQTDHGGNQ